MRAKPHQAGKAYAKAAASSQQKGEQRGRGDRPGPANAPSSSYAFTGTSDATPWFLPALLPRGRGDLRLPASRGTAPLVRRNAPREHRAIVKCPQSAGARSGKSGICAAICAGMDLSPPSPHREPLRRAPQRRRPRDVAERQPARRQFAPFFPPQPPPVPSRAAGFFLPPSLPFTPANRHCRQQSRCHRETARQEARWRRSV